MSGREVEERNREPGGRRAAKSGRMDCHRVEGRLLAYPRGSVWVGECCEAARGYALPTRFPQHLGRFMWECGSIETLEVDIKTRPLLDC